MRPITVNEMGGDRAAAYQPGPAPRRASPASGGSMRFVYFHAA